MASEVCSTDSSALRVLATAVLTGPQKEYSGVPNQVTFCASYDSFSYGYEDVGETGRP